MLFFGYFLMIVGCFFIINALYFSIKCKDNYILIHIMSLSDNIGVLLYIVGLLFLQYMSIKLFFLLFFILFFAGTVTSLIAQIIFKINSSNHE